MLVEIRLEPKVEPKSSRKTNRYRQETLSEDHFASIWAQHRPLVVTGVDSRFQTPWTPNAFAQQFGDIDCQVEDCESGEPMKQKVRNFFSLFGQAWSSSRASLKLKVRRRRSWVHC